MDETYRMLGREHEADLEREAHRRRLAGSAARQARPKLSLLISSGFSRFSGSRKGAVPVEDRAAQVGAGTADSRVIVREAAHP
jgi:hypothetical protein